MPVSLIDLSKLKEHEKIDKNHLTKIKHLIENSGVFKEPIIVDKNNLVILDGHHRFNSCKQLGLTKIPCITVDYMNDLKIKVVTRQKEFKINKEIVINMGLSNKVFPAKTTKHYIPYRIKKLKIPIEKLI